MVLLSLLMAPTKSDRRPFNSGIFSASYSFVGIMSLTLIEFSVIVPVLSTQSTLTRASVSILFISWSRTFLWASLIELTANATLASRYNPSGIIPRTAATMETILFRKLWSLKKNPCTNNVIPIGINAIPTNFTNLSSERIISDCSPFFIAFASNVSLEM